MTTYFEAFNHANSSDNEETVLTITSNETEKKKIVAIHIISEVNDGVLTWYIDREKIGNHYTGKATIQNFLTFNVDSELNVGEEFKITLKNVVSGTNAEIVGLVEYQIL